MIIEKVVKLVELCINLFHLKCQNISYGKGLVINGIPFLQGNIKFQDNCKINSGMIYNPIGGDRKTILIAVKGKITIGNNVGMSNVTMVSHSKITIEDDVKIGGSCKIYDTDFHPIEYHDRIKKQDADVVTKPIHIKRGAFIGAHSIILKGVTIGEESVIGAGSVIAKSIPDGEIWAGNPAVYIKKVGEK